MSKNGFLIGLIALMLSCFGSAAVQDQAAPFGALTLSGAGGFKPYDDTSGLPVDLIAVTDQTGATRTWSINGDGALVADGTPGVDDSVVLTCTHAGGSVALTIGSVANKYSVAASMSELASAWADANAATAQGILVRDGDDQSSARAVLAAKSFASEFVIEPHVWVEDVDPRLSARNALLAGITLSSGCGNVTIQGFDFYDDLTGGETEAFHGVIRIDAPSSNVTIRQNEIRSRDFAAIYAAGDFSDNLSTMNASRGITASGTGSHTTLVVDANWMHDVTRGVYGTSWVKSGANRSSLSGNYILDTYSNFTTLGGNCDGVDIFDNRMMHVWAAQADTAGAIPATSPHSSTGLSFDAPSSGIFNDVAVMGNFAHVGWNRTKLHADNLDTAPDLQATGMKFNDPSSTAAYQNIVVAFNTIVSHGITCEFSGASGIEIFNNTLAYEAYSGLTGTPIFYFQGVEDLKLYRNISAGAGLGINDGGTENGSPMVSTAATAVSYLNFETALDTGDLGLASFYVGDGVKGFDELTIEEALAAYVPKPGTFAMTNAEKLGALGTGYYSGGGSHTAPAYAKPAPSSSTHSYNTTVWDGATYLNRSGVVSNISDGPAVTIGWQGAIHSDVDASEFYFYQNTSLKIASRRLSNGKIRFYLENASGLIMQADTDLAWTSSDGVISWAFSADLSVGRAVFAINGESSPIPIGVSSVTLDDLDLDGATTSTLHADTAGSSRFKGNFDAFFIADEFVDLDTSAGLSQIFATDGRFKDLGSSGTGISAGSKPIVISGNAAAINGATGGNGGDGGAFAIVGGTVSDTGSPTPPPSSSVIFTDGSGRMKLNAVAAGGMRFSFNGPIQVQSYGAPVVDDLPLVQGDVAFASSVDAGSVTWGANGVTLGASSSNVATIRVGSMDTFSLFMEFEQSGSLSGSPVLARFRDGNGVTQQTLALQTDGDFEVRDPDGTPETNGETVSMPVTAGTVNRLWIEATQEGALTLTHEAAGQAKGTVDLTVPAVSWYNQIEEIQLIGNSGGTLRIDKLELQRGISGVDADD